MAESGAYVRPGGLDAAFELMARQNWRLLAGGTDLYPATSAQTFAGDVLDLSGLDALRGITLDRFGLRIGALTSWAEIAGAKRPPALQALRQAALQVGGRQIQNAGTIGGNLCNASPAADGVPPLLALDARVELLSASGARVLDLDAFLTGPRRTALEPGEMLAAVLIPRQALMGRSVFLKLGARAHLVISIASVAVRILEREGRVADARVAVGAASPVPVRVRAVERALEGVALADAAGRVDPAAVTAALAPLDDVRASAAYRFEASTTLIRRAVADLAGGQADG